MPFLPAPRALTLAALVVVAVLSALAGAPTASAQLEQLPGGQITLTAESFFPRTAIPGGAPAVANITIEYTCAGFTGDITLTATLVQGDGTPTLGTTTITPESVPDCQPPSDRKANTTLSVVAGTEGIAGSLIVVNITATATTLFQQEAAGYLELGPTMGPIVDVSFSVPVDKFEVEAGSAANASFTITSRSNDLVLALPEVQNLPTTWTRPDVPSRTVETPLPDGTEESKTIDFQIVVPPNAAAGEYTLDLVLLAHSVSEPSVKSAESRFPLTITVTTPPPPEGESGDSPPSGVVPVVLALGALVALVRRRT